MPQMNQQQKKAFVEGYATEMVGAFASDVNKVIAVHLRSTGTNSIYRSVRGHYGDPAVGRTYLRFQQGIHPNDQILSTDNPLPHKWSSMLTLGSINVNPEYERCGFLKTTLVCLKRLAKDLRYKFEDADLDDRVFVMVEAVHNPDIRRYLVEQGWITDPLSGNQNIWSPK